MSYTVNDTQREQYRREGYFILRGAIPREDVEALKTDIQGLVDRSAEGQGPDVPWINKEKRIPNRLGHLLRPDRIQPAFIDSLARGPYFPVTEQLLGAPTRHSLFGMLASGDGQSYVQGWHRDLAPIAGERQLPILEHFYRIVAQINAPLFPDRYLQIVPGSHLRQTTETEREVHATNPTGEMPGQLTVETEPGDVVFYYPNLWHRGYNPEGALRWTMHHAFIVASQPVGRHERGQEDWIGQPDYLEAMPPAVRVYMQRYLDAIPDGPSPDFAKWE